MSGAVWIGIDLGTQGVRAVALDDHGRSLGLETQPLRSRRQAGRHEQDPACWLAATRTVLARLVAALPPGARPRALAVSGTSGTVVRLGVDGTPRGPGVMYDDRRGAADLLQVQQATAALASRLGYRMQATWALPKVVGLVRGLGSGEVLGHQPDVVTGWLAGRRLPSELSSALKTGVDLDAVAWPEGVLAELGVRVAALNPVVASGTVIGAVGAAAAGQTGLPAGCLLVAGMTDGCAAQLSAGAVRPGAWNSVLGTTLVVKGAVAARRPDPTGAVYAHRAPFDEGWYPGGASSTGAGALRHWLPGRDLDRLTAALPTGPRPTAASVAYPLVGTGERFPFVAPTATAFFPEDFDRADDAVVFEAVLHGVAWVERLGYDLLDLVGYDVTGPVLLTGGGSRNPVWTQLRADVLGRPVQLPSNQEGAAGMAVLAAAGTAAATDPALRTPLATTADRLLAPPRTVRPTGDRTRLADGYAQFLTELEHRGWADPRLLAHARERIGS